MPEEPGVVLGVVLRGEPALGGIIGEALGLAFTNMLGDASGVARGEALGSAGIGGIGAGLGVTKGECMMLAEPAWWAALSLATVLWSRLTFSLAGIMESVAVGGPWSL